jgi:hypothetical protein
VIVEYNISRELRGSIRPHASFSELLNARIIDTGCSPRFSSSLHEITGGKHQPAT